MLNCTRLENAQPKNGPRSKAMPCTANDGARDNNAASLLRSK